MNVLSDGKQFLKKQHNYSQTDVESISITIGCGENRTHLVKTKEVDPETQLYTIIDNLYKTVLSRVKFQDVQLTNMYLTDDPVRNDTDNDFNVIDSQLILVFKKYLDNMGAYFLKSLISTTKNVNDSKLAEDNILTAKFVFDRSTISQLETIRGDILTTRPQLQDNNTGIRGTVVNKKYQNIAEDDVYHFPFETENPTSTETQSVKKLLNYTMANTISTEWEHRFTAYELSTKKDGKKLNHNDSYIRFGISIPVVDGEIGVFT